MPALLWLLGGGVFLQSEIKSIIEGEEELLGEGEFLQSEIKSIIEGKEKLPGEGEFLQSEIKYKIEGKERITGNESLQSKEDPRHAAGNLPHTKHPGISPGCDHSAALPYLCTSSIKPMMIGIASVWWLAFMASLYLDRFS